MATVAQPVEELAPTEPAGAVEPPPMAVRRFRVDEYHKLIQIGILGEDEPLELLKGWIVHKMPRNPPHDAVTGMVGAVLRRALPDGWCVRVQSAIDTADSEPEPDLAVVRGTDRDYLDRHPGPVETALVVEVADSSLKSDRTLKAEIYGRAGIPTYWIVNLVERRVEVLTEPSGASGAPGYRRRVEVDATGSLPLIIDGQQVANLPARDLLP